MEQISLFDILHEKYQVTKPIKLIECFAGYGSQNLALKYLGANYEHHRICEWATKSIQAYNDIHIQDYTDYSQCCTYEEVVNYLFNKGISMNYNEPMTYEQIKRKGEKWCRTTYNNIIATRNLVNIQQAKAYDLDITDTENFTYLLTYSFPCQDLSLAGKGKGMTKGSGTRSGLLWEVERLLDECVELNKHGKGHLPNILIMENVPQVVGTNSIADFQDWVTKLESLGYSNFVEILNAKDYGIPQNRERCFMVSILGDYTYKMPKKRTLKYVFNDFKESVINESFFLSERMVEGMKNTNFESYKLENKLVGSDGIVNCIIARFEGTPQCIYLPEYNAYKAFSPKECWRLMGVKDNDFENVSKNQSNSSLYHLAGDSIVTTCLMGLMGELLGIDYQTKITELIEDLKQE